MAMNYLEFKRQLMVDPYDRSPDFIAALEQDSECAAAALESDHLEALLQHALRVPVPHDLLSGVTAQLNVESDTGNAPENDVASENHYVGWLPAMVAGLAMGVGLTATLLFLNNEETILEEFVVEHWQYDGEATELMALESPMDAASNGQVMATLALEAGAELMNTIMYARNCGTPHGNGVHMVMRSGQTMLTVLYIPDAQIPGGRSQVNGGATSVLMENGDLGVIAVFGDDPQQLERAMQVLRSELKEHQRPVVA